MSKSEIEVRADTAIMKEGRLGPLDLFALSAVEVRRRDRARMELTAGAWALVTHAALSKDLGEDVVEVVAVKGNTTTIRTLSDVGLPERVVPSQQIAPCLALGDRVKVNGTVGVVVSVWPSCATANAVVPEWGTHGNAADTPHLAIELNLKQTDKRHAAHETPAGAMVPIAPRSPNLAAPRGLLVRGRLGGDAYRGQDVGPTLSADMFLSVASFAEPAQPYVVDGEVCVDDGPGGRSVLCKFLGGATLWIWAAACVECNLPEAWWDVAPSRNHHPDVSRIRRPSESVNRVPDAPVPAVAAAPVVAALPPAETTSTPTPAVVALAASKDHMNTDIDSICAAHAPLRGDILVARSNYTSRLEGVLAAVQKTWSEDQLVDVCDDLQSLHMAEAGAYQVRSTRSLVLPDGRGIAVAACAPVPDDRQRPLLIVGLLETIGGHMVRAADDGSTVARVAKGAVSKALGLGRDAVIAAKDHVIDTGVRKATAGAHVLAERALVGGQETARDTTLAIVGAVMGMADPQELTRNAPAVHAFNEASVMGMKAGAWLADKFAPSLNMGKVVRAAAATLEEGIDRKQAQVAIDTVAPIVNGGLRALAAAGVKRFLPSLAPAAPPAPALEPTPEDKPPPPPAPTKPKRTRAKKSDAVDEVATATPPTGSKAKTGGAT